MAPAELDIAEDTEQARIERWRLEELVRAGYDRDAAAVIAARSDIDLHQAVDLVRAGCSPELALAILI